MPPASKPERVKAVNTAQKIPEEIMTGRRCMIVDWRWKFSIRGAPMTCLLFDRSELEQLSPGASFLKRENRATRAVRRPFQTRNSGKARILQATIRESRSRKARHRRSK